ncbi:MAG: UvrD-helicase domain-containing protein [Janthinobacterium lividum]
MNRLISASAGSGKTYELTNQYLRLLLERHRKVVSGEAATLRIESLLAATFTRKAAGEIFDRILKRLADAALSETGLTELRQALGEDTLSAADCQDLLLKLCRNLHRVQVGTLDSFFQRLCRVYRQEAGLSGEIRMTSPDSPRCLALQKEAIHAMLEDMNGLEEASDLLHTLTRQKASSAIVPKLLTLLQGISETVTGAEPEHWEKLQVPIRPAQSEIDEALSTLEAYLLTLTGTRWPGAVSGDLARFRNQQWEKFLDGGLAKPCFAETCTYYNTPIPAEQVAAYGVLLAAVRHELLTELKQQTLALRDVHTKFSANFAEARRAEGLVLFSETPALLTRIVGDSAETARRLDSPLQHMLLDEFQDTSDAQWSLLKDFALQAALAPGSVFVVGDAKQAIYGWRGGRAEIFDQIENDIQPLDRGTLEKSYRSSKVVLDIVNEVFQAIEDSSVFQPTDASEKNARNRETAAQWASYFKPHEAAKALRGRVELCVSPVPADPKALVTTDGDTAADDDSDDWNAAGASYHLVQCAARIAEEITRLPPGTSVGVLVRTNKTLAQLTDLLRAKGVSVSSEGVGKIADDPAIELILSALLLADHPGHSAAAYHVACSPLAKALGLEPTDYADAAKTSAASTAIRRRILFEGYAGVLTRWAAILAPYGPERTAHRLGQIVEMADGFDALPPMRPSEFVRAVRESSAENPGAAPVRVMTINRAKGLEFDAVFLPDLEWKTRTSAKTCVVKRASVAAISKGASPIEAVYARPNALLQKLDPTLLALAQTDEADEVTGMLCLLYVAMTRPRHALYLYVAPHTMTTAGVPQTPGLKPAAILRAALAESPTDPRQGSNWTRLRQADELGWAAKAGEALEEVTKETPIASAQPELRFRKSDGVRRSTLPNAMSQLDTVQTAGRLLRRQSKRATE